MSFNDRTAKKLLSREEPPEGANHPTIHIEYACPCGGGRVIEERTPGFGDYWAMLSCPTCSERYRVVTGCGYFWELQEK